MNNNEENTDEKGARIHYLTRKYSFPFGFKGTIIDLETTGLDPETDEIISFGMLSNQYAIILASTGNENADFQALYEAIAVLITTASQPIYAYNANFEKKFIRKKINISLPILDAQEPLRILCEIAKEKGQFIKWPRLIEVTGSRLGEYFGLYNGEIYGDRISTLWKKYLRQKKQSLLEKIIYHNLMDVVRTAELLLWTSTYQLAGIFPKFENDALQCSRKGLEDLHFNHICETCQEEKKHGELFAIRRLVSKKSDAEPNTFYVCNSCFIVE